MAQKNFKVNNGLTTPKTTFLYDDGNTANTRTVNVSASSSTTANYSLTLPNGAPATNGQVLAGNTDGTLRWTSNDTTQIVNGNSNVVVNANANVTISSAGNANIVVVTGTGANIAGTANITGDILAGGNVNVTSNINAAKVQNGNSNIAITANANITITAKSNATMVISDTGANITGTANVSGNANVGNLGTATAIITTGNITTVNTGLVQNGNSNVTLDANANVNISSNGQANVIAVSSDSINGLLTVTGNIVTAGAAGGNITGANVITANTFLTNSNGAVTFVSNNGTSTQQVTLQSSTDASFTANYTLTLPVTDGTTGQYLQTDGSGILSWSTISTSSIVNGNSNVVVNANANVTISSAGNANILVVTGTGAIVSGNLSAGNLIGIFANGNSNITIDANANIGISSNGQSNIITISSDSTNGLLTLDGNLTTAGSGGNITGANVISANTFLTSSNGAVVLVSNNGTSTQQVTLQSSTDSGFSANYSLTLPINDGISGQLLTTDGSGILSWSTINTSIIANGNSNVSVPVANGNVNISSAGNANVFIVTGLGAVVNGTVNATSTITALNALFKNGDGPLDFSQTQIEFGFNGTANYQQYIHTRHGASNAANNAIDFYTSDGNATGVFPGNAILGLSVSNAKIGVNIANPTSTLHVVGDANITANANVGNLGTATAIITTGNITTVNTGLVQNGNSNVRLSSNANVTISSNGQSNIVTVSSDATNGLVTINGNLSVNNIANANVISANTFKTTSNGAVVLVSNNGTSTQQVTLKSSTDAGFTANYSLTLPVDDGSSGQALTTDGSGILSWTSISTSSIVNGNSNVVVNANANVTISSAGNANIVVVTGTGANITGTANVSGNLSTGGNLTVSGTGISSIAGNIDMNGKWVGNIGYAVADTDAASKLYVDTIASTGITYHAAVNAATTTTLATATSGTTAYNEPNGAGNGIGAYISTTGTFTTIDSVTINGSTSVRILVKNEANAAWNGVYNYTNATAITRSSDADTYGATPEKLSLNDYFFTLAGTVNNGTAFIVSAPSGTITFGTSNIEFSVFSTSQVYTGGTGITVSGTVISANAIQTQITEVGTLSNLAVTGNTTSGNFIGVFANGNSNVSIPSANGNVNISAVGNANVLVVTGTGANVTGYISATGAANIGVSSSTYLRIIGGANNAIIRAQGDSDAGLIFSSAGTGNYVFNNGSSASLGTLTGLTVNGFGQNYVAVQGGGSGAAATVAAEGVDTNINLALVTKGSGNVVLSNAAGLSFVANNGTDLKQVTLKASTDAAFTANYSLTLPTTDGTSGQVLETDGSGVLSWASISTSSIVNGNSNVVVNANANVTISSAGNANVVVVTGTDTIFGSNVQVGAVNANSGIVFNANTFQTKIFASNAAEANYSLFLPANVAQSNGLSLVANTDGTLRFASVFTPQPTIKFTAAASGNNQTFTDSDIANFANSTAYSSVYRNGILVDSSDYTFNDTTLTMNVVLVTGDTIAVASTNLASPSATGYVAGTNTQVQFNDVGALGASSSFTFDKTSSLLTVGNLGFGGANGNVTVNGNTWSFGNITGIPTLSLAEGGGNTYITAPPSNNITILTQNGGAASGWSGVQLIDQGSVWIYTQNQTKNWEFANNGNLNAPGNITTSGNINAPKFQNGNSSVAIAPNSNITLTSSSNTVMTITTTGANVAGYANITGTAIVGSNLLVGTGTSTLVNPIGVFQGSGGPYVQLAVFNSTSTASADLIAYGNNGDDTQSWTDIGFTGNTFNDANYTVTAPGDGYLFVQGNSSFGGNLVIATGNTGTTKDIIFATGGFLTGNIKARLYNANGLFSVTGNISAGNLVGPHASGNSNISITSNGNITLTATSNSTMIITATGANITGTANISANTAVGGNLGVTGSILVGGKKAVNGPAFRAYISTGQTILSNGSQQKVTFGGETFDTDNCFGSSTFTPTVEGYYQFNATVRIAGISGTSECMLVLYKNGSEYARGTNESGTEQGANFYSMQVSDIAYANGTTDNFEIYIQQSSGASKDTTAGQNISYFSGVMVRGA